MVNHIPALKLLISGLPVVGLSDFVFNAMKASKCFSKSDQVISDLYLKSTMCVIVSAISTRVFQLCFGLDFDTVSTNKKIGGKSKGKLDLRTWPLPFLYHAHSSSPPRVNIRTPAFPWSMKRLNCLNVRPLWRRLGSSHGETFLRF